MTKPLTEIYPESQPITLNVILQEYLTRNGYRFEYEFLAGPFKKGGVEHQRTDILSSVPFAGYYDGILHHARGKSLDFLDDHIIAALRALLNPEQAQRESLEAIYDSKEHDDLNYCPPKMMSLFKLIDQIAGPSVFTLATRYMQEYFAGIKRAIQLET